MTSAFPRKPRLTPEQRRALELLASSPHGVTEELLVHGYGLSSRMLPGLVRAGLATVERRVILAGGMLVELGKVRITAAGQRALAAGYRARCTAGAGGGGAHGSVLDRLHLARHRIA